MAKSPAAKSAPKTAEAPKTQAPAAAPAPAELAAAATNAEAPKTEAKVPLAKMRGPRGVAETAKITLLVANPKRVGSKAFAVYSCYKDQMTVGEFCDAVDATENKGQATPNLVYDAAHKFISIEGYTPGQFFEAKPKAPKVEKVSKVKAPTAPKTEATPEQKAEQAAAQTAEIVGETETETLE